MKVDSGEGGASLSGPQGGEKERDGGSVWEAARHGEAK